LPRKQELGAGPERTHDVVQNHPGNGKSWDSQEISSGGLVQTSGYLKPTYSLSLDGAESACSDLGRAGVEGLWYVWNHVHLILHWELTCKLTLLQETALSLLRCCSVLVTRGIKRVLEGAPQWVDHG
jgi:hypothetical protein